MTAKARNPGPAWGYSFLRGADRWMPRPIFRTALAAGSWIALVFMPAQRRQAAAYWQAITGKNPKLFQLWRQFFAFAESLIELLRLGEGRRHRFELIEGDAGEAFQALAESDRPALFGTFHVGNSDLLGYALSEFGRRIHMIRTQVENSDDTRWLRERFAEGVSFIWVDRPEEMLFAIKDAVEAGHSLAMKCDRPERSGRLEPFWFLGKRRLFPFAIYHFAVIFQMPAVFATGWPRETGRSEIEASPVFEPNPEEDTQTNLKRAREHFQGVLHDLERRLARDPALWFNFGPLNPEARAQPC